MSTTTKSIKKLLLVAHEVSSEVLPKYSHESSPQKYTQAQLFSCLVLKTYMKMDYRGVSQLLRDFLELRQLIGLKEGPHFTTLQKACQRLLTKNSVRKLLEQTLVTYNFKKMVEV